MKELGGPVAPLDYVYNAFLELSENRHVTLTDVRNAVQKLKLDGAIVDLWKTRSGVTIIDLGKGRTADERRVIELASESNGILTFKTAFAYLLGEGWDSTRFESTMKGLVKMGVAEVVPNPVTEQGEWHFNSFKKEQVAIASSRP
jgi:hypothetical protein